MNELIEKWAIACYFLFDARREAEVGDEPLCGTREIRAIEEFFEIDMRGV